MGALPLQIVLRSPEITLKGRNQGDFWSQLRINVRHALRQHDVRWPVKMTRGRLYVEARDYTPELLREILETLERVSGVTSLAPAVSLRKRDVVIEGEVERGPLEDVIVRLANECFTPGSSFAIRAHRVDKRFPMSSTELERWLGQAIRDRTAWEQVSLSAPDRTFHVDVYSDSLLFYADRRKGIGGLPVGSSGLVLGLLSGGIDSPVASYLLARRGCHVDFFHMSATHVREETFDTSVPGRLAKALSRYTLRSRLFIVPYTHFDLAMSGQSSGYEPVLFRRFLFRVAEALAKKTRAVSLVTGDSLSQVASQTIENLIASDKAVEALVLRPLVGTDKQEIMRIAEEIGTYETSIEPYKDCCALYARRVKTKARHAVLSSIEKKLFPQYEGLIDASLNDAMWGEYDCGTFIRAHRGLERIGIHRRNKEREAERETLYSP